MSKCHRAEKKWSEVDAVCRDCGETYKKRVNVSQKDFDNSSDIMKHFIKRGMCNQCRLKRNDSFRLRSDSIVANKKERNYAEDSQ